MRRILLLPLLALPLALAAPAAAVEPTRDVVQVTTINRNPCPSGVSLVGVFHTTREITTFYDDSGNAVSQLWHVTFEGTSTNPLTGASLTNRGLRIFHRDLVTGEFFTTGPNVITKLPDGGVAIGGAGRLAFDSSGALIEHDGPDTATERAQLCEALGA
jgi:hypothetical protein